MKQLLLTSFLLSVFSLSCSLSGLGIKAKREIKVFIRVDDIFMLESKVKPQEIDEFLKIAEKHNAKVILATIPNRLLQKPNESGLMESQLKDYVTRGHQIAQHGFDHRCPFTKTTDWEFYNPEVKGYTEEERLAKVAEGKRMLESVIGKRITNYVGPGSDNNVVMERDDKAMRELGFLWLSDPKATKPYFVNGQGYFFPLGDHTWGITEETYQKNMDAAKADFLKTVETQNYWGILFHDHFTRKNYNDGITLRWFDEFLTWMESRQDLLIRYYTLDEYYKESFRDFSTDLQKR